MTLGSQDDSNPVHIRNSEVTIGLYQNFTDCSKMLKTERTADSRNKDTQERTSCASSTQRGCVITSCLRTPPNRMSRPAMTNFHSIADLASAPCSKSPSESISPSIHTMRNADDDVIDVVADDKQDSQNADHVAPRTLWHARSTPSPETPERDGRATTPKQRTLSCVSPDSEGTSSPAERAPSTGTPEQDSREVTPGEGSDPSRARKGRTIYKAQQVFVLEQVFSRTHYPDPEVIETLAKDLDISENKIKVWFQNKRARWRRRAAESGHPMAVVGSPGMGGPGMTPWPPVTVGQPMMMPPALYTTPMSSMPGSSPFLHPYQPSLYHHTPVHHPGVSPVYGHSPNLKSPHHLPYPMPPSLLQLWAEATKLNTT